MPNFPSDNLLAAYAPLRATPKHGDLLAHQAHNVFTLWDAWEKESGGERDIPFWAAVWPGDACLAHYVLANPSIVSGKTVLDLGCGGAIAGIAAARAGAACAIANDTDPVALYIAERNARANNAMLTTESRNLLAPGNETPPFDLICVADMFYECSKTLPMLAFLRASRSRGATVLVADGERHYAPRDGFELLLEETIPVDKDLEGVAERVVRILSMC